MLPNVIQFKAFDKALVTDNFIGETVKLNLQDFAMGQTKIEGTLWDKKKTKAGTIKLIIDMKSDETSEEYTMEDGKSSKSISPKKKIAGPVKADHMALVKVDNEETTQSDKELAPIFDLTATPEPKRQINDVGLDESLLKKKKMKPSDHGSFQSKNYSEDRPTSRNLSEKRGA